MDKKALLNYCLNMMGITQFVRRSLVDTEKNMPYLVCIDILEKQDDSFSPEKQQLLSKMLAALQWPAKMTAIEFISLQDVMRLKTLFTQKIQAIKPIKILFFGVEFGQKLDLSFKENNVVLQEGNKMITGSQIPTISTLLTDPNAKKIAWKTMQNLICNEKH